MDWYSPIYVPSKNARHQSHRNCSFDQLPIHAFHCGCHHRRHEAWLYLKNVRLISYHAQTYERREAYDTVSSVVQD